MREDTKVSDILKSTFKETPRSFHNAVNNALAESVQGNTANHRSTEEKDSIILNSSQLITAYKVVMSLFVILVMLYKMYCKKVALKYATFLYISA